ncbi:MAG: hypothetical protein ACC618_04120, partial [Patescibacteria group bacterium]
RFWTKVRNPGIFKKGQLIGGDNMIVERSEGPSKLDERLEAYKDSTTEHIILTSEEAQKALVNTLLSYYYQSVSKRVNPLNKPSPKIEKIEALKQIADEKNKNDRFDYTAILQGIRGVRRRKDIEQRTREAEVRARMSILAGKRPPQEEI